MLFSLLAGITPLGIGCAPAQVDVGSGGSTSNGLSSFADTSAGHTQARYYWTRYVKNQIEPQLAEFGVSDALVKRVAWFGLQQGIFTIGTNPEYGEPNGPQTPLGMSNCGDSIKINTKTAFPDCFGADGYAYRSGNWQVGIGGVQVSDYMNVLPTVYAALYGDTAPADLGQPILDSIGDTHTFPDLTIEEVATKANARWASVILRDPEINVYIQTYDTWITDGRDLGYGESIVDDVWSE
ncbi:MAG: hypothetical protein ABI321_23890 [Polyangia bacterium]